MNYGEQRLNALKLITQKELDEIIKLHQMWLNHEEGGVKANLTNRNCKNLDFHGANLENAIIENAAFYQSNMQNVSLKYCNLGNASFIESNLTNAKFDYAWGAFNSFEKANLTGVRFFHTQLRSPTFRNATMKNADLKGLQIFALKTEPNLEGTNLKAIYIGHVYKLEVK